MTPTGPVPILVTHSGSFHCDDAFAYATLRLALGLTQAGVDHTLTRTRDPVAIAAADIVWDVGAVYDAALARFDHHQRGAPTRPDSGVPYSAAGLVWLVYGLAAVQVLLPADAAIAATVSALVEDEVIRRIDATDNGISYPEDLLGLSTLVEDFNPPWNSAAVGDSLAEDAAFMQAAALTEAFLRRRVAQLAAQVAADGLVAAAHCRSADPRVLELDRKMPWQGPVHAHGLPVLYAVYPVPGGNWMVDAMPPEPHSFAQRLPLPEPWAGLQDAELAKVSGVADAVFAHPRRFVAAARSRNGALSLAAAAIRLGGR